MIPGAFAPREKRPAPPVDFCNRYESASSSADRPNSAAPRSQSPASAALSYGSTLRCHRRCGWLPFSRTTASRNGTGQGPMRAFAPGLRRQSLGDSFTPTRSGSDTPCRLFEASIDGSRRRSPPSAGRFPNRPNSFPLARCCLPATRSRGAVEDEGRLARPSAKRTALRRTRGAFSRWTNPLGSALSPQAVPSLWIES